MQVATDAQPGSNRQIRYRKVRPSWFPPGSRPSVANAWVDAVCGLGWLSPTSVFEEHATRSRQFSDLQAPAFCARDGFIDAHFELDGERL